MEKNHGMNCGVLGMKALVIGVAFTDIKGFPFNKYNPVGTNHGRITTTHGGVARNVAENLANLGVQTDFPMMVDNNAMGSEIRLKLEEAGVNLEHAISVENAGTGIWLAVFDENGDLVGSVSQMPNVAPLENLIRTQGEALVRDADFIVCEFDTTEFIATRVMELAEKYNKPVYVIVGNMNVILARRDLLAKTRCVIMNNIEASRLFEADIEMLSEQETLSAVLEHGKRLGLRAATITMGSRGCVYADFVTGENGILPARKCTVVDTTGAGDAFFSAETIALSMGHDLKTACEYGRSMAAMVLGTVESTCPKLGMDYFNI